MSAVPPTVSEFKIARDQIDSWRGRCLDHFARGERAIGATLLAASESGRPARLKPMAGQRLTDLEALIAEEVATPKQIAGLAKAITGWHQLENTRTFLAHGEVTVLVDQRGDWSARFDLTRYKANCAIDERWIANQTEAEAFEVELQTAFLLLSQQLGQLRKRLSA